MLRTYLAGLESRQPQSVGNMCIIPLVSQGTEREDIGTIADIYLHRDIAYDRLELSNQAKFATIVPNGFALITKERAQDRAVASKTLLAAGKTKDVNAFCVQSSQSGYMSSGNREQQESRMLPATIRLAAYNFRQERNFSALWGSLGQYNTKLGVEGNFLASFFTKYKDQLDSFVAEFELVPHQRGAIIFINDEVIGVEISPNPMTWSAQWETLIRDCYGSEAISQQGKVQNIDESALLGDAATLEELAEKVDKLDDAEFDFAEQQITELLNQAETVKESQKEGEFKVLDVETPQYVGQAVTDKSNRIIDLTLLRREAANRGFTMRRR